MEFVFDIETLPAGDEMLPVIEELYKDYMNKRYSGPQKSYEEFLGSTALDGAFGRILCIGYAIDNEPVDIIYDEEEEKMLKEFWQKVEKADWIIGHNIVNFDLPFIMQRSVIKNVKPSREIKVLRYSHEPIFDTYMEWTMWSREHKPGSLDRLAKALGYPTSKDEMCGSEVYDYYRAGKIKDILRYCQKDVDLTRKIYKRLVFAEI